MWWFVFFIDGVCVVCEQQGLGVVLGGSGGCFGFGMFFVDDDYVEVWCFGCGVFFVELG